MVLHLTKRYIYEIVSGKVALQTNYAKIVSGRFTLIEIDKTPRLPGEFEKLPVSKISTLAFPKLINTFLETHSGTLFGEDNSHKK
jgi:hypothetical protein